jgi:hypothetical protein
VSGFAEILNERRSLPMPVFFRRRAQDRRGMQSSHDRGKSGNLLQLTVALSDLEGAPKQALCRNGAEADDEFRVQCFQFGVQPWPAGTNLFDARLLMYPQFAARLPLEVFDRIGDVHLIAVYASLFEALVEQFAGRTHERTALLILVIAGLFTDHHDCDVACFPGLPRLDFAKHGLGGISIEIAPAAPLDGFGE